MRFLDRLSLSAYSFICLVIYAVFNLCVVKHFSPSQFGQYGFYTSVITFFSTFSLLSLPWYLQKEISLNRVLDRKYFIIAFSGFLFLAIPLELFFMRGTELEIIFLVTLILFQLLFSSLLGSYYNAIERYRKPYLLQLIGSMWMVVFSFVVELNLNIKSLTWIFLLWTINLFLALLLFRKDIVICFSYLKTKLARTSDSNYLECFNWLFFSLIISIPYDFMRFYERYLVKLFANNYLLGLYTFYLMVFGFFSSVAARSMLSGLLTKFVKMEKKKEKEKILVKECIYFILLNSFFLGMLYAVKFAKINFLAVYTHHFYLAFYVFVNSIFIYWAYLIMMVLNIKTTNQVRVIYFFVAMLIFLFPTLIFKLNSNVYIGLFAISTAYILHFILVLILYCWFNHRYN